MDDDLFTPLPREEVLKAIERKNPRRVPMIFTKQWDGELMNASGGALDRFLKYPIDIEMSWISPYDVSAMIPTDISPASTRIAYDQSSLLPDWRYLDEFLRRLPDPETSGLLAEALKTAAVAREKNRYLTVGWWGLFFERPWGLRGMQNLLLDYHEHPGEVHRLNNALCDLYVGLIRRAARELHPDGFWTSDDLGHQTQLMMSPAQFREFLKPYYERVGEACRENGMHFWLHSCGNNTEVLPELCDAGVAVFHPVQKHTMDEQYVAHHFGDRMTFLVGFDVQHTLIEGTPEEIRAEVRYLIDLFDRTDGGMCFAGGNNILLGTPIENIEAYLDEALRYGISHRAEMRR